MKQLLLICALLGLGNAMASDLDFTLVNETKQSFEGIYISAADDADWDGNLLPDGGVLNQGGRLEVKFDSSAKSGKWDLNVVDADGVAVTFKELKLGAADSVTLKLVDGEITAEVE